MLCERPDVLGSVNFAESMLPCLLIVPLGLASVRAPRAAPQTPTLSSIAVEAPSTIVRATVPLPPGHEWKEHKSPFTVVAPDGTRCPTQWERVTSWPGTAEVRVAEILAEVPLASGPQVFRLELDGYGDREVVAGPWAASWLASPPAFLVDGAPVATQFEAELVRSGRVATTRRFFGPHLVGWVTASTRLDVVELVLIAHDGTPHSPTWYFDSLAIQGVGGFATFAPEPLVSAANGVLTLVPERGDGKANWIEQRGWRRWHLVLHDGSKGAEATAFASGAGWGVSDRWTQVGAYQPHALPLPDMPARKPQLASKCASEWSAILVALATGAPFGMNATEQNASGRLGFRHAWGQHYGGVTGGAYRFQWAGVETALSGAVRGWLELDARFRMIADRQPVIACDDRGRPLLLEAWLDPSGNPKGGWRISSTDARFDRDGGQAGLGWSTAVATIDPARVPPEEALLARYSPIDWQHHDRAHQVAVSLAWLANDASAKWAIEQYAELWRWRERSRLGGVLGWARENPGLGSDYGRDAGHLYSAAAAAYALGDDALRARFEPMLSDYREMMTLTRMPNGLWQQRANRKEAKQPPFGDGTKSFWAISKGTEEALLSGSLAAIAGSVPGAHAQLAGVLRGHAVDGLWTFLWNTGATGGAPTNYIGVRPVTYPGGVQQIGPPATDPAAVPRDGFDSEEIAAALGYAAWIDLATSGSLSPEVLAAVKRSCGNSADPIAWLDSLTLNNLRLDDVAPLYAALVEAR